MARPRRYRISGVVREAETGRPLAELVVRAFDKDVVFDDLLGFATTDAEGRFGIRYGPEDFRDWLESQPDVYLRVYDRAGTRLLHDGKPDVRRNAGEAEQFEIEIPGARLG